MNATLLSHTKLNSRIRRDDIRSSTGTDSDTVIEYAGRVCYNSEAKMGYSPNFILARVKEGHLDIIEHAHAVFRFDGEAGELAIFWSEIKAYERYVDMNNKVWFDGRASLFVSANLRTWLRMIEREWRIDDHADAMSQAHTLLHGIAPKTFRAPIEKREEAEVHVTDFDLYVRPRVSDFSSTTLLSASALAEDMMYSADHMHHATFLIEHVSRAFTHQIVRHRLLAFSQQSQRYVDIEKSNTLAIIPPDIVENKNALHKFMETWESLSRNYRELREMGIRKEDARFLLPNAAESKIVVSGTLEGWRHFIWLRCDKPSQWEIRAVALNVLTMLNEVFPGRWGAEMAEFLPEESLDATT